MELQVCAAAFVIRILPVSFAAAKDYNSLHSNLLLVLDRSTPASFHKTLTCFQGASCCSCFCSWGEENGKRGYSWLLRLLSRESSEPSFEIKLDVFLLEILRAVGWLTQPNTYSIPTGNTVQMVCSSPQSPDFADPGIFLCIPCWWMRSFQWNEWGGQRRELGRKICANARNLYWKSGT